MRLPVARSALSAALLILAALAAAGCGSTTEEPAQTRTVVTVIREVPADASHQDAAQGAENDTAKPADDSAATADRSESSSNSAGSSAGKIRVPNVVGKDHQLAQDTMQAEGLYNLSEEDATGQGRMLLFDRNWTVVSQSPKAGSMVDEDATVTLRSKKDDE